MGLMRPTYADVCRAEARLRPYIQKTPVVSANRWGASLKLENLQHTGAYKVRGATNALMAQLERGDRRPVIAASAGNHAAGMAWAAKLLGLRATAIVPLNAPRSKVTATQALGATVQYIGECFEESEAYAKKLARDNNWRFLPAFDHPDVICGQGTIALEILEYQPDVVVVPIGGGGLISGMGIVLQSHGIRLVGVHVAGIEAMAQTLAGKATTQPRSDSLADGVRVSEPGRLTRTICRTVVDEIVTVTEKELRKTMTQLMTAKQLVTEGAGALATAALHKVTGKRKLAIVSGGNIDANDMIRLLGGEPPAAQSHSTVVVPPPMRNRTMVAMRTR